MKTGMGVLVACLLFLLTGCDPAATPGPSPRNSPVAPTAILSPPTEAAVSPTTAPAPPTAFADAATSLPETAALQPGSRNVLGDAWTRPADGMVMVYVPPGTFQMGSTEAQIEAAIALCRQHYSPCNNWYYEREGPVHNDPRRGFREGIRS